MQRSLGNQGFANSWLYCHRGVGRCPASKQPGVSHDPGVTSKTLKKVANEITRGAVPRINGYRNIDIIYIYIYNYIYIFNDIYTYRFIFQHGCRGHLNLHFHLPRVWTKFIARQDVTSEEELCEALGERGQEGVKSYYDFMLNWHMAEWKIMNTCHIPGIVWIEVHFFWTPAGNLNKYLGENKRFSPRMFPKRIQWRLCHDWQLDKN